MTGAGAPPSRGAAEVIAAARRAIGVRFKVHGRSCDFGLDCVGLAALALRAGGFTGAVPDGYALRGGDPGTILRRIAAAGLTAVRDGMPGDLALFETGPGQLHFAILVPGGLVHADAMLRRVVERPGVAPWPLIATWRVREE